MGKKFAVITGNANKKLASKIVSELISIAPEDDLIYIDNAVTKFSNGETRIEIGQSLRNRNVFVLQSTTPNPNNDLVELLLILDTLNRCECDRVVVVFLNYPYARQDRKIQARVPISAKLVATLVETQKVDGVITMELHSPQISGFFNCTVNNLYTKKVLIEHIKRTYPDNNICIVAPDAGSIKRAKSYAKDLDCEVALLYKHRDKNNNIDEMVLIGNVTNKNCVMIDDMCDTGGTICTAANILQDSGAKGVVAYATHAVLSGPVIERINNSALKKLYVTDTIDNVMAQLSIRIEVISVAVLFAEAIYALNNKNSLELMFE